MAPRLTYTAAEAANALGISESLVRRLIARGELPSIRMGERRLLVPKRALEEFVNAATGERAS